MKIRDRLSFALMHCDFGRGGVSTWDVPNSRQQTAPSRQDKEVRRRLSEAAGKESDAAEQILNQPPAGFFSCQPRRKKTNPGQPVGS